MNMTRNLRRAALFLVAALALGGGMALLPVSRPAAAPSETASFGGPRIVAMRRITEAQYRSAIADIFGPDIRVAGRFEPVVRPVHEMLASGAFLWGLRLDTTSNTFRTGGLRLPMISMGQDKIDELRAVMGGLNVL